MSVVEHTLHADPAGVYPAMDFATRDDYRHAVEQIAKRSRLSEDEVARQAVELAGVAAMRRRATARTGRAAPTSGTYLVDRGRRTLERAARVRPSPTMLVAPARPAVSAAGLRSARSRSSRRPSPPACCGGRRGTGVGPVGLVAHRRAARARRQPARGGDRPLGVDAARAAAHPAAHGLREGIPAEHRTVVAVPTMLTDAAAVDELLEALEVRFLANRDENLSFALLTDFRDAAAGDDAVRRRAARARQRGIEALNAKYGGGGPRPTSDGERRRQRQRQRQRAARSRPRNRDHARGRFFLFHRARRWNAVEGVWMGWERKRGKLEEFNAALRGDPSAFDTVVGPVGQLRGVRYVITLDSDTQLPRDSARQLVGTIAHPLNRPHFDERLGRVTDGYSILQPRVGVSIPSASRSRFARLFAGDAGIDPYTRAVSDVYQDLFGEGSFIGKGIYDVDAFQQAIGGRLPENRILSHDLIEGAYARSGLVSDVMLFEDFPTAIRRTSAGATAGSAATGRSPPGSCRACPAATARRRARDEPHLRRFRAGRSSTTCGAAWCRWRCSPPADRLVPAGRGAVLHAGRDRDAVPAGPADRRRRLARWPGDLPRGQHARLIGQTLGPPGVDVSCFSWATLPYDAYISGEAIVRTASRVLLTRRKLLEWRTASEAQRWRRSDLAEFYVSMWILPAMALAVGRVLAAASRRFAVAAPVLRCGCSSPASPGG